MFPNPAFSADFLNHPLDADAIRESMVEQGIKALDLQQRVWSAQLEQMTGLAEVGQQRCREWMGVQSQAAAEGITMMLDAQKSALKSWKSADA